MQVVGCNTSLTGTLPANPYYLGIVGSRTIPINNARSHIEAFIHFHPRHGNLVIVSGGAKGIDSLAVDAAFELGLPFLIFHPIWSQGPVAGVIRNSYLIKQCDELLAIWDGASKGTRDSITKAIKKRIPVTIYSSHPLPEVFGNPGPEVPALD